MEVIVSAHSHASLAHFWLCASTVRRGSISRTCSANCFAHVHIALVQSTSGRTAMSVMQVKKATDPVRLTA